jgi:predicted nucleotidyltransferase
LFTKNDIIDLIKNFVTDCNSYDLKFDKVILFGSYAKNNQSEDSDIDLALISNQFSEDSFENALKIAPILLKYLNIDAVTFPSNYFENGDPFINEIKRTGLLIN